MAIVQSPDQLEELEHSDEMLLRELKRTDELLLNELERLDAMLLRIVAEIDQLPKRVASATRSEQLGPLSGNMRSATARSGGPTRPFDPYPEDEAEVPAAEDKYSAVAQVARKVQSRIAVHAQRDAFRAATLSLAVALLATAIAVFGLIVAAFH